MSGHFILLVIIALVVGAICKARNINPAIPLMVVGLSVELVAPNFLARIPDPEFILTLVLAPLIFAAGLASSAVDLRKVRRSVLLLAVVLVVLTTFIVGGLVSAFLAVPLAAACCLGAVLAPTDAVAASAVASKTGLPRRVKLIVEGESLANDGTALTLLRVTIVAAVAGSVTAAGATKILVLAVVGGVLVGVIGGWFASALMRLSKEPIVVNSIVLLTPFALYEVSEIIGGSGLLTVVIAGVWIAHTAELGAGFQARLQAHSIWSLITFLLESFAFTLVGAEFIDTFMRITQPSKPAIVLSAFLLAILLLVVRGAFMACWYVIGPKLVPSAFTDLRRTAKEFVAIALLGVRGPVSVLAALSLPLVLDDEQTPFPDRDLILILTFTVVFISLLLSLLAAPIIKRLDLNTQTEDESLLDARRSTAKAALLRLEEMVTDADMRGQPLPEKAVQRIRAQAVRRVDALARTPERADAAAASAKIYRRLAREMLAAEREEVARLRSERRAPGEIVRQLTQELDVREAALGSPGR